MCTLSGLSHILRSDIVLFVPFALEVKFNVMKIIIYLLYEHLIKYSNRKPFPCFLILESSIFVENNFCWFVLSEWMCKYICFKIGPKKYKC